VTSNKTNNKTTGQGVMALTKRGQS